MSKHTIIAEIEELLDYCSRRNFPPSVDIRSQITDKLNALISPSTIDVPSDRTPIAYRHKKTGGTYTIIGYGEMQTDNWRDFRLMSDPPNASVDMAKVVIYRSTLDGRLWVRPVEEFEERFEPVVKANA